MIRKETYIYSIKKRLRLGQKKVAAASIREGILIEIYLNIGINTYHMWARH